jgi:hypothetical protein
MKNKALNRFLAATAVALVAVGSFAPVEAFARGRSTTTYGSRGGVYHRQVSQSPGAFSASASAIAPNGKTASRSFSSQKTATGRTTSAQSTGFNGKNATYDSTRTKTETGYIRQASATGANGATAAKQVNVSNNNGSVTRTVSTTTTPPTP